MSQIILEYLHGAAARVLPEATAFPHRYTGFNMLALSQWTDPSSTDEGIAWARDTYTAMQPLLRSGGYVNYQSDADGDMLSTVYGGNYSRLQMVKAVYDPQNVFHLNHNIAGREAHSESGQLPSV
jgi:FAD/FMN-containing dehydrogenase